MTIYVGNLPFRATEQDLRDLFRAYGTVVSCRIPLDRNTGRPRGFAFVALDSSADEEEAITALDSDVLMGRILSVKPDRNEARPRPPQIVAQPVAPAPAIPIPHQTRGRSAEVPMEYRAQIPGRCQRQFVRSQPRGATEWLDSQIYVREWRDAAAAHHPYNQETWPEASAISTDPSASSVALSSNLLHTVTIDWRLLSNSGIDDGFIRPVIGPGGWPMIPGSSIKGLFKRACRTDDERMRWCGGLVADQHMQPGLLRFHGAWPRNHDWGQTMLDIAHPQYNWQVGFTQGNESHNANAVISLWKPTLSIRISSHTPLTGEEWQRIQATLDRALAMGLGGRTAAGYGHSSEPSGEPLFACSLEGQGSPPKLLDANRTSEFRPTMFRAAIRSMALRLFGGLTDERTALRAVGQLFGSIGREEGQNLGLLTTAYTNASVSLGQHRCAGWAQPVFATKGCLQWRLIPHPPLQMDDTERNVLKGLISGLHGLTMALGGFGRGWRRPDHRLFLPGYYALRDSSDRLIRKPMIGCHWEWRNRESLQDFVVVKSGDDLKNLLTTTRHLARQWLLARGFNLGDPAPWREVIHPGRMMIWTRRADSPREAKAIHWFHRPADGQRSRDPRDLRRSDLAGQMNQVGCLWNRLLAIGADEQNLVTPSQHRNPTPAPMAAAIARPAPALARPGAATQRPQARVPDPLPPPNSDPSVMDEVWMKHSPGPFLETLVLFPSARESASFIFIDAMRQREEGEENGFRRLTWT